MWFGNSALNAVLEDDDDDDDDDIDGIVMIFTVFAQRKQDRILFKWENECLNNWDDHVQ